MPTAVGIDTVAVSLPCSSSGSLSSLSWSATETADPETGEIHTRSRSHRLDLGVGFFDPKLVESQARGSRFQLEFSVPRFLRESNNVAAPIGDVRAALTVVQGFLHDAFGAEVDVDNAWLRRVDLVRDFSGVGHVPRLLQGLSTLSPSHKAIRTALHTEPVLGRQRPSCLVRQTTEYLGRLYDKTLESCDGGEPAPEGQVRFELQLRGSLLGKQRLRTLDELEQAPLTDIARRYFRRLALDGQVIWGAGMEDALVAAVPGMTEADLRRLSSAIGLQVLRQYGVTPSMSAKTVRRHDAFLTRHGLSVPLVGTGEPGSCRLDFDSGTAS